MILKFFNFVYILLKKTYYATIKDLKPSSLERSAYQISIKHAMEIIYTKECRNTVIYKKNFKILQNLRKHDYIFDPIFGGEEFIIEQMKQKNQIKRN